MGQSITCMWHHVYEVYKIYVVLKFQSLDNLIVHKSNYYVFVIGVFRIVCIHHNQYLYMITWPIAILYVATQLHFMIENTSGFIDSNIIFL